MFPFPPLPEVPDTHRATGTMSMRYEDVAQDGRLLLDAIPHGLGDVAWVKLLDSRAMRQSFASGLVPILSRIVLQGFDGPVGVRRSLDCEARMQLSHVVDDRGEVERLMLNMWLDVSGPKGRTHGPTPEGAGEPTHLGRCFAEHVFTRPFGPPEARKVRRLEIEGVPEIPADRYVFRNGEELLEVPPSAVDHDAELVDDAIAHTFSIGHTDSNQHVNSLVYPRLFEEAALRRVVHHGHSTRSLLARHVELAYRKPCFAGDRVRVRLRLFGMLGGFGAVGAFVPEGAPGGRPCAYARILLAGSGESGRT